MLSSAAYALEIRVVDGEGATHVSGTRSYKGITVQVTNDAGDAVANARVRFLLPDSGPSGVFPTGTVAEEAFTDAQGNATVWGIQWGPAAGDCQIRIFASAGEKKAGTSTYVKLAPAGPAAQYEVPVASPPAAKPKPQPSPKETEATEEDQPARRPGVILTQTSRPDEPIPSARSKWLIWTLAAGGAVGGGLAWRMMRGGTSPGVPVVNPSLAPAPQQTILGLPAITIGKP